MKQGGFEGVEKNEFRWLKDASNEECFKLWNAVCFELYVGGVHEGENGRSSESVHVKFVPHV